MAFSKCADKKFCFENLPFSKSIGKYVPFRVNGGLSIAFFTIFKMKRHRVNAISMCMFFAVIKTLSSQLQRKT